MSIPAPLLLIGVAADLVAVVIHGVVGHRAVLSPLPAQRLPGTHAFGDAEMTRRVLIVTWHIATAAFGTSAAVLLLLAIGALPTAPVLARSFAVMHGVFLLVGLVAMGRRFSSAVRRPIPLVFVTCMSTAAAAAWFGV